VERSGLDIHALLHPNALSGHDLAASDPAEHPGHGARRAGGGHCLCLVHGWGHRRHVRHRVLPHRPSCWP
jgi:hypothetical protein